MVIKLRIQIKKYKTLAVFILIITFWGAFAQADFFEIKISKYVIQPGDFLLVKVFCNADCRVKMNFLGITKELNINENGFFIGMAACSYYTSPGSYSLSVEVAEGNTKIKKEVQIEVIKRHFPEENIWVAESIRKKILTEENRISDAAISKKARSESENKAYPPLWQGPFIWPVKGIVTAKFGLIRYVNKIENGRHSGLDIAAPTGTPVVAANQGQVVLASSLNLTGLTVMVYHGLDVYTTYAHLSKINVKVGDFVHKGEIVGEVGATGLATGPHLHLTFRVGDIPVDPYLFLEQEIEWNF